MNNSYQSIRQYLVNVLNEVKVKKTTEESMKKIYEITQLRLSDDNIIVLFVECNDSNKINSFDSYKNNKDSLRVTLVAVFDEYKNEYQTTDNSVTIFNYRYSDCNTIEFSSLYVPVSIPIKKEKFSSKIGFVKV